MTSKIFCLKFRFLNRRSWCNFENHTLTYQLVLLLNIARYLIYSLRGPRPYTVERSPEFAAMNCGTGGLSIKGCLIFWSKRGMGKGCISFKIWKYQLWYLFLKSFTFVINIFQTVFSVETVYILLLRPDHWLNKMINHLKGNIYDHFFKGLFHEILSYTYVHIIYVQIYIKYNVLCIYTRFNL